MAHEEAVRRVGDIVDPVKRAKAAQDLMVEFQVLTKELYELRQRAVLSAMQGGMTLVALGEELGVSASTLSPSKSRIRVDYVNGG